MKAEAAVKVSERKIVRLKNKRDRLDSELDTLLKEIEEERENLNYLKANPILKDDGLDHHETADTEDQGETVI